MSENNQVKLGQYRGLAMKIRPAFISEAEIDECLEMAREESAQTHMVTDRTVAAGDTAVIDFEGFKDGVAFAGGKGTDYPLVIGSHSFIDGFEDQLIGAEVGKEVRVNVTFPEHYQASELAGQPAVFLCTVKGIQEKILPELDDEFVEMKYGCKTVAECREKLKEKMLDQREQEMHDNRIQGLVLRAVNNSEAEVPEESVQELVQEQINSIRINLMQQGVTLEKYLEMTGSTREVLIAQIRPQAERQVKTQLVLRAIVEAEALTIADDEVEGYLSGMAANYGMTTEQLKERLDEETLHNIKEDLLNNKAVEIIVSTAVDG